MSDELAQAQAELQAEQAQREAEKQAATANRLQELFKAQGIELEGDDESVVKQLAGVVKAKQEAEEKVRLREQDLYQYQEELNRLKKPAEVKEQPKPAKKKWEPVEIPPQYLQFVKEDGRTGLVVPKEGLGPLAAEAARIVNQARQEEERRARRLVSNPIETLLEAGLDDLLQERLGKTIEALESKIQESLSRRQFEAREAQESEAINKFREQHKAELFHLNEKGEIRYGIDGAPALTKAGEVFVNEMREAMGRNVDPIYAMNTAYKIAKASAPVQEAPEKKKESFLDKARREVTGNRKPSQATPPGEEDSFFSAGYTFADAVRDFKAKQEQA